MFIGIVIVELYCRNITHHVYDDDDNDDDDEDDGDEDDDDDDDDDDDADDDDDDDDDDVTNNVNKVAILTNKTKHWFRLPNTSNRQCVFSKNRNVLNC